MEVGPPPTDEKRTSVSRAQSSWAGVGDVAAVVSQVAGIVPRKRLVDQGGDLELALKSVQLTENWRDAVKDRPSSIELQRFRSTVDGALLDLVENL